MLEPQVPQVITLADAQVDDPRLADIRQLNHPRLRPDRQPRLELDSSGDYIPASRPSVILADGALPIARMCGTDSAVAPPLFSGVLKNYRNLPLIIRSSGAELRS